jgi:hypothetical protein
VLKYCTYQLLKIKFLLKSVESEDQKMHQMWKERFGGGDKVGLLLLRADVCLQLSFLLLLSAF